jgi:uncharacterized protein YjbJ (UPF0337 family)
MNKHQTKGMANQATGEVKQQVGKLTGDTSLQARGHAREAKGKLQKEMGDAKEVVRRDDRDLDRTTELERSRTTGSRRTT